MSELTETKITVKGDKETKRMLNLLPDRIKRKALRKAVNLGSTPTMKAARRNAPKQYGILKKSIGKRLKTYTKFNTVTAIIGPRRKQGQYISVGSEGKKRYVNPSLYAHLTEDAVKAHDITITVKSGKDESRKITIKHPGITARNWLKNAATSTKEQSLNIMKNELGKAALAEAKKLGKA